MQYREYQYTYINSTATTGSTATILVGKGFLHTITKNKTTGVAGEVIRVCDAITGTTANVGIISSSAVAGTYLFDVALAKGLIVDTGYNTDATVTWSKD